MLTGFSAIGIANDDSLIRSVEYFTVTIASSSTTGTATIDSVNTSFSTVFYSGQTGSRNTQIDGHTDMARVELTDASTVTATRDTSDSNTVTVRGCVVQWRQKYIQSIQTGTVDVTNPSATDSISSVTTGNSVVLYNGFSTDYTAGQPDDLFAAVELTDSTTVTAYKDAGTSTATVAYTVLEFKPGVLSSSSQRFNITPTGTTGTASISPVTTARSIIVYGSSESATAAEGWRFQPYVELTNGTTVTATRSNATSADPTVYGTVLEFSDSFVKSVTRDTITIASSGSSNTDTVSVDPSKSVLLYNGFTSDAIDFDNEDMVTMTLTDGSTVTFNRDGSKATTATGSYELVEFN